MYDLLKQYPNLKIEMQGSEFIELLETIMEGVILRFEKKEKPERYLTRKETAQMFGIDLSTLWQWNKKGYLKHVEVGGKRRYKLSDIERIMGRVAS